MFFRNWDLIIKYWNLLYLVEGSGEAGVVEAGGDVVEGGDGSHEDAEVGHGQAEQVHVHHSWVWVYKVCMRDNKIRE